MRISRAHTLISAAAGSALALLGPALPAGAQVLGGTVVKAAATIASPVAPPPPSLTGNAPVTQPPPSLTTNAPVPPASIPERPVAPVVEAIAKTDPDAVLPVAPDAPVATASLPAPGAVPSTAVDAALTMANMMDGAGGGISNADLMAALESAAAAGQPMAMWRLGTMYENGEGVAKDDVKAFDYFSQIANDHADAAPRSLDADIVAQSFVKMGDYYRDGLPDAGIAVDKEKAEQLILHAATYFGNADAQYRVGELYLDDPDNPNPLQGARWLALAAHKGHVAAQAKLGDLLFNGAGIKAQPAEGLMWLSIAHDRAVGTPDEDWISELLTRDMSVATPRQREEAVCMAELVEPRFEPRLATMPGD
jgi:hypothetical protein